MGSRKHHASGMGLAAACVICFVQTELASANLIITVQENAGPVAPFAFVGPPTAPTSGAVSTSTAHYDIQVLFGLEQQTPDLTQLLSADIQITKLGNFSDVLHITLTGTDFTSPVTPPDVSVVSSVSDTCTYSGPRPGNMLTFESTVGSHVLGIQSPPITITGSSSDNKTTLLSSLSAPFSIVQTLDFVLTNDGDQIRFAANTVATPTPEPAAMVLFLTGLALLKRRRRLA